MKNEKAVKYNIKFHDRIHRSYEDTVPEIFNPLEQERLRRKLEEAKNFIETGNQKKISLDYGCGSGNLTKHLIDLDFHVISGDVSQKFLNIINEKYGNIEKCETLKLNGKDLSNIVDNKFDMVATYSVLHHIPDYLKLIEEIVRITKPGGIIYIDHEVNENYWEKSIEYSEFQKKVEKYKPSKPKKSFKRFLKPSRYINKIRILVNPRYQIAGDIHVWPDDHIEWDKIEKILIENDAEVICKEDYLLYRKEYPITIYRRYKNKCNDTRVLIARKKHDSNLKTNSREIDTLKN